ncbi:MAG TPA: PQQ-binding-like beta-propeller repeat protein [Phycisphaerae bacterium]|nr:PQQ-binding-like beta-propeller repeat protein [Phycisphaerae bacterium]
MALMVAAATDGHAAEDQPGTRVSPAAQSDALPAPIAKELQGRKGICLDLDCGDGKLAASIAKSSELVVFALAGNDKTCENAREFLDEARLHGSRATVAVGSSKQIPLPNGYCNLIVAGQLPPEIDFHEIIRVLNPNGVAVVGGADADTGRLKNQAAQAGIGDCKVDGDHLVIRGKMPEGSDDWTHIHRGPDNNRVSLDESIRPPFRTQWLASAYGWMLAAKGRVLIKPWIMGHSTVKTHRFLVRDGQNGAVLWEHEARDRGVWAADTLMAAGRVYTIDARQSIVVLDAGTGKELATFKAPAGSDAECAGWYSIASQNNVLYVVGDAKGRKVDPISRGIPLGTKPWVADRFFALDARDGRLLWVYKAEPPVNYGSFALGPEAAFFASGSGAVAVDLKTGTQLWRNPDIRVNPGLHPAGVGGPIYHNGRVHYVCAPHNMAATLDARTGALAYSIIKSTPDIRQVCIGNTLYAATGFSNRYRINAFDNTTGLKQPESFPPPSSNGCRPVSGAPFCLGSQFGIMDLKTKEWFYFDTGRIDCCQGLLFANGMAYYSHWAKAPFCGCTYPIKATVAMAPAGSWRSPKAPDVRSASAERCKKGAAFDSPLAADAAADDWPSYRRDACRSACANSAVKLPAAKGWQRKLSGTLTPVSVAAGLVFTASDNGRISALDAASGEVRWTYLCGNEIPVTPTYWKGRLFAGSTDGWVYCLEAKTGKPAWRFQGAPEDRFISVKGRLYSMWPVFGGVVVDDDTAYFAAGMCSIDGVYLYAINPTSGQVRWVKEIGHLSETPRADNGITGLHGFVGISPYGALALGRDLLYVPNGRCRPGVFKKTDGDVVGWPGLYENANHTGGSEVVVAGDEIFNGGGGLIGTGWDDLIGYDPENPFRAYHASSGQSYAKETRGNYSLDLRYATPASMPAVTYIIRRASLLAYRREKLAAVYPLNDKDKAAALAEATLWTATKTPAGAHSIVTAGSQVLVAGTSEVFVLDETGQKQLARFKVDGKILRNGLSVADGKAYIVTEEGGVVCLGNE